VAVRGLPLPLSIIRTQARIADDDCGDNTTTQTCLIVAAIVAHNDRAIGHQPRPAAAKQRRAPSHASKASACQARPRLTVSIIQPRVSNGPWRCAAALQIQ